MVIEVKLEHWEKQPSPILVTDEGMVIDFKLWQFQKQLSPKLVMDDGIVTDFKPEQRMYLQVFYYQLFTY